MKKNVVNQKWVVFAFNRNTGVAVTGDQANITANIYVDGVVNAVDNTHPTQLEDGYYYFTLTADETNGDYLLICPETTTANTQVIGCPAAVWTQYPQTGDNYAVVTNATYGNSALNTNIGTVNTAVGNVNTSLSAAKGVGFVTGTDSLEAISDSLTLAKGATFDTTTDSLEAIRNRGDVAWITGGGMTGAFTVIITTKDNLGATIPTVGVEVWNSDGTSFYEKQFTNSSGQVTFNMNAGIYLIKMNKTGYTWSNVSQTIIGNSSITYTGTVFTVTPPTDPSLCRIYTFLKDNDGSIPSTVVSSLKIVSLPFDITNYFYSATELEGIYSTTTGLLYWDVVKGATVKLKVSGFGIDGMKFVIPNAVSEEITDLI